jgi:hypothetical protein
MKSFVRKMWFYGLIFDVFKNLTIVDVYQNWSLKIFENYACE